MTKVSSRTYISSLGAHCLHAVAMALLPLLFIGCSSDERASLPVDACQVGFDIVVNGTDGPASTRTPEGDYRPGEGYENYIDIPNQNFRFLFFTENNTYIGRVNVESVTPTATLNSSKRYYVLGGIDKEIVGDIVGKSIKVVALANWGEDNYKGLTLEKGKTTITDICHAGIYTYAPNGFPSVSQPIPLFGVTNAMTLDFDALNLAHIGTIHLLRAVAKVELELVRSANQAIEWVKLSRYHTQGYCAPTGVTSQSDYVHGKYDDDYANTPHVVANAIGSEPLQLTKMSDTRYLIYVPEYDNLSDLSQKAQLIVKFKGDDTEYNIDFKYYMEPPVGKQLNDPFDILRNYWYRFSLSTDPLCVTVQMVPYDEIPLTPDFGLLRNPNWVPVYDEDANVTYWYDRDTGLYYNDQLQPILDNPFWGKDPVHGWSIVRSEEDGSFLYYYDGEAGKYYNEKYEEIPNPYNNTDEKGRILIKDKDGNILYYFDDKNNQYYNRNNVAIPNPYSSTDPESGWLLIRDSEGVVIYYYDEKNKQYYDKDKQPIDNPFIA